MRYKIGTVVVCSLLLFGAVDAAYGAGQAKSSKEATNVRAETSAKRAGEYVRSTVDRLNVRTKPNMSASVIEKIGKTNRYQVLDNKDEWVKIKLSGKKAGWVSAQFIEYVKNRQLTKETEVKMIDSTNLRSGPGTNYKIVAKAEPGESFPIVATEGEWYKVSLRDGGAAYVASWVVRTDFLNRNEGLGSASRANGSVKHKNKVYIYHTHNRESWKNVVGNTKGSSIDDRKVNITLVGKQLGHLLQEKGVPTLVGDDDFTKKLEEQKLSYGRSYSESRKAVNAAAKAYPSLAYFFDIHRDSDVPREKTTIMIDDKPYARILFMIGTDHPDYAKNKKFAEALNALLEKKYPGLSRGILLKSAKEGNGEYNQSVSPGSLLMEFGGANNTLQECLRTAEAFADVFADYVGST